MKVRRFASQREYELAASRLAEERQPIEQWQAEMEMASKASHSFTFRGYSYPAQREVDFYVDWQYSFGGRINWRERCICPVTNLNNRLRASLHFLDMELAPYPCDAIFLSEQVTPLYDHLKKLYPHLIGSEFLGANVEPGQIDSRGVRHENLTALSFPDCTLDYVLSFDCFEHFPDFLQAFRECARVLKPRGKMMWSVPFAVTQKRNTIRAVIEGGAIRHIHPPEFHGDPLSAEGCLCYQHFGWEMLEQVCDSGFSKTYATMYESHHFGYIGEGQLLFVAVK